MSKILKAILAVGAALGILGILGFFGVLYVLGQVFMMPLQAPDQKIVLQRLSDSRRGVDYVLTSNGRLFDQAWYVYLVRKGADIPNEFLIQNDGNEALFWTYTERRYNDWNANIELAKQKYLVFWRGGLGHALYDLDEDVLLVDDNDWGIPSTAEKSREQVTEWKRTNVDAKIQAIIAAATLPIEVESPQDAH